MIGKKIGYLRILGFSHWGNSSTYWKCLCICGRLVNIDRRRLAYAKIKNKSCGCLRNVNSRAFFIKTRKRFFSNIRRDGDHWIFNSSSRKPTPIVRAFNKNYTCQRLAYIFWNHLKELSPVMYIESICKVRGCVKPSHLINLTAQESNKLKFHGKESPLKGKKYNTKGKHATNDGLYNI